MLNFAKKSPNEKNNAIRQDAQRSKPNIFLRMALYGSAAAIMMTSSAFSQKENETQGKQDKANIELLEPDSLKTIMRRFKITDPQAVPTLIEIFTKNQNNELRHEAAHYLGYMGDLRAVPVLIEALKNDKSSDIRSIAAKSLGILESKNAVPALMEAVRKDADSEVRAAAAEALGRIRDAQAVPVLLEAFKKDPSETVRGMAVTSLGFLCGPPIGQMFIQYLKKEKSDFVKEQIIELLGRTKNQKAVPILIEILRNSKYSYTLKSPAAYAIACILKEKSMQLFIDIIKTSKDSDAKSAAIGCLAVLNATEAEPLLIKMLEDKKETLLREKIIMVLGKIGGEESLKALEEMKRKGMPYWHEKAIEEAIAKIRERLQRK